MRPIIDITNYESFALDYLEGNLSGEELDAFEVFLSSHPEIKSELEGILPTLSKDSSDSFVSKNSLYKIPVELDQDIDNLNYIDFFIAYHEGDLNENQQKLVYNFLDLYPATIDDFESIRKARLKDSVKFSYKEKYDLEIDSEYEIPNYDKKLIGFVENDLSFEEQNEIKFKVENSIRASKDLDLYRLSHLITDESIVYPYKSSLLRYKTSNIVWFGNVHRIANLATSVAAAILIGFFEPSIIQLQSPIFDQANTQNITDTQTQKVNLKISSEDVPSLQNSTYAVKEKAKKENYYIEKIETKNISSLPIARIEQATSLKNNSIYPVSNSSDVNNITASENIPTEKITSSNPVFSYAAQKIRSFLKGESNTNTLDVNWKNAAYMGLSGLGKITESDLILSYVPENLTQDKVFSVKSK